MTNLIFSMLWVKRLSVVILVSFIYISTSADTSTVHRRVCAQLWQEVWGTSTGSAKVASLQVFFRSSWHCAVERHTLSSCSTFSICFDPLPCVAGQDWHRTSLLCSKSNVKTFIYCYFMSFWCVNLKWSFTVKVFIFALKEKRQGSFLLQKVPLQCLY